MMDSENDFIGPVNLGNPNEISMNELASRVLNLCKSNSKLTYKSLPNDDPKRRNPDISLATKKLNWHPKTNFEKGIKLTFDWYTNHKTYYNSLSKKDIIRRLGKKW